MTRTVRLGIFIVLTLAVLAAGVFLIGSRQFLFSSTYELKANFNNVAGLANGAEVRVGGINKGTVKQIQLPPQPGGGMTVVMNMEKSTRKVVRQDSVASILTEGLLGNKYVEISFGTENGPAVVDGSSIQSVPTMDISDLMKKTNEILDSTKQTMSNMEDSSDHIKGISSKIDRGQGTLGALVKDRSVFDRLSQATDQAKLGATAFSENMEALKHNFFLRGFFNRRGYEDVAKLTGNEIKELPQGQPSKTFGYDPSKVFDKSDTAKLRNEKLLNDAGHFLEAKPFGTAVVEVSGGMKGDADDVRQLTEARALVIRDYLVKNFKMDDTRLKTMGTGKNPSSNDSGLVEIVIFPEGTPTKAKSALK